MSLFQSQTYEYTGVQWKQQALHSPKSATVFRNPYTKFTWKQPGPDQLEFTDYDPIWCFVGHRRLCVGPPYPVHPLVNILGADFNEIHGVDIINLYGEYTKPLHFRKASARIRACEKEPEVPDTNHTFE